MKWGRKGQPLGNRDLPLLCPVPKQALIGWWEIVAPRIAYLGNLLTEPDTALASWSGNLAISERKWPNRVV